MARKDLIGIFSMSVPPAKMFGGERYFLELGIEMVREGIDVEIFAPPTDSPVISNVGSLKTLEDLLKSDRIKYKGIFLPYTPLPISSVKVNFKYFLSPISPLTYLLTKSSRVALSRLLPYHLKLLRSLVTLVKDEKEVTIEAYRNPLKQKIALLLRSVTSFLSPKHKVIFDVKDSLQRKLSEVKIAHLENYYYIFSSSFLRKLCKMNAKVIISTFAHLSLPHEFFMHLNAIKKNVIEGHFLSGIVGLTEIEARILCLAAEILSREPYEGVQICHAPIPFDLEYWKEASKLEGVKERCEELHDGVDYVVASSTLHFIKGIYQTAEAVVRLSKELRSKIALYTFGRASKDDLILWKSFIKKWESPLVKLKYLGYVDDITRVALFKSCEVFCMPSIADSFGMVYAEAWYNKKPVIGSLDNPAMHEIIARDRGILVPFNDPESTAEALISMLQDATLRTKLGNNGKKFVEKELDVRKILNHRILPFYSSILEGQHPSRGPM